MDTLRRSLLAVAVLTAVVATAAIGASATPSETLVVTDAETGDTLLETPVSEGDNVTLAYTHSVEKTPVKDIYVVDDSELRTDRMVFHSHGAGLPSDADIEETDEGFVVRPNASYETLSVVPGSIAGHELVVVGERYDLVELSDGPVRITLEDRSVGDRITGLFASTGGPNESQWEPNSDESPWVPNSNGFHVEPTLELSDQQLPASDGPSATDPDTR
ncbi:C4-dicarboxylate ABC transporter [Halostagnicola larsenii XH-48]|uniref:C4-dicarboxylate ABC transporter n=1 Tax=Halostagnicola larsenii XH-48 TaxID=797299 RepID=W0JPI9_9EURY|nr:DUF1850 domain-containing protein [Halostagnicola larsenii]AHF98892.1 C4-dicarboxylate ABC transporter [Halostagnicola larsenii XH-48]